MALAVRLSGQSSKFLPPPYRPEVDRVGITGTGKRNGVPYRPEVDRVGITGTGKRNGVSLRGLLNFGAGIGDDRVWAMIVDLA